MGCVWTWCAHYVQLHIFFTMVLTINNILNIIFFHFHFILLFFPIFVFVISWLGKYISSPIKMSWKCKKLLPLETENRLPFLQRLGQQQRKPGTLSPWFRATAASPAGDVGGNSSAPIMFRQSSGKRGSHNSAVSPTFQVRRSKWSP